jgi:hypothetical protein
MDNWNQIDCEYLTPNKTIETLSYSKRNCRSKIYIYNYKGVSFRVFTSKQRLEGFWKGLNDEDYHFESESTLDLWLEQRQF